jgi:serum/glucocorticoid-regulated kinase 2
MLAGLPPFYSQDAAEQRARILGAPLRFEPPEAFSPEARSLLEGLLERDPSQRLGAGREDVAELRRHPFFAPIDWVRLERREIEPPFRPPLRHAHDTSCFEVLLPASPSLFPC